MNEEKDVNNQPKNQEVKIEFVPAKPKSGATSEKPTNKTTGTVSQRRYTSAKRDFSQLPHRQAQNGAQRPQTEQNADVEASEKKTAPTKKQSRKKTGINKAKVVLWALLVLAIVAGIVVVTIFATGNRQIKETFKDGDIQYSISYFGEVDENNNITTGTLHFSDNSTADISANGDGTYTISYSDGSVYVGKFDHMHRNGQGTYTLKNGDKYTGNFHYDRMWGEGTYEYANGDKYVGKFEANVKSGVGTYTFRNGDVYVGEFANDMRNGKGVYTYFDGSVYEGSYVDNKRNDENASMTIKYSDGTQDVYVGSFVNDSREGKGSYTWSNGDSYVGNFTANNMNGEGTYKWANGRTYTGQFNMGNIVKDPSVYPEA